MPRLRPWLLRQAKRVSPDLVQLLFACRSLLSARQELRWIADHVRSEAQPRFVEAARITDLCRRRGRGVPLQYILGTQPFGRLSIRCVPGVLIPRLETEAYTYHLAEVLKNDGIPREIPHKNPSGLNIIDFCSGSGCIPLLLFDLLRKSVKELKIMGMDVSPTAVKLGQTNIKRNSLHTGPGKVLDILGGDIFRDQDLHQLSLTHWDVITSNPPYISSDVWDNGRHQLGYSVRKFEPKLALVPGTHLPPCQGWSHSDIFYSRLLVIATRLRAKVLLLEIGDEAQARRVVQHLLTNDAFSEAVLEIWRDAPDLERMSDEEESLDFVVPNRKPRSVHVKGSGNMRSIFVRTGW